MCARFPSWLPHCLQQDGGVYSRLLFIWGVMQYNASYNSTIPSHKTAPQVVTSYWVNWRENISTINEGWGVSAGRVYSYPLLFCRCICKWSSALRNEHPPPPVIWAVLLCFDFNASPLICRLMGKGAESTLLLVVDLKFRCRPANCPGLRCF